MKHNIGMIDRWIRFVGGAALILLAMAGMIDAWGYIGIVPVVTAVINYCPIYQLLGIDTCRSVGDRRPS
jgi:hypothetical protein